MAFKLPLSVVSQGDVGRLLRELNGLNDFFVAAAARQAGTALELPKATRALDELAKTNQFSLLKETDRSKLVGQLTAVRDQAPNLHISFAVDPPPKVVEKILTWLRDNLDPHILLQIGLQPNIGAGCVLRTANHEIDMSLRQQLISSKAYLIQLIHGTKHA